MQVYNTRRQRSRAESSTASPLTPSDRSVTRHDSTWAHRHRSLLATLALLITVGVIVNIWLAGQYNSATKAAVAAEKRASEDQKAFIASIYQKRYELGREAESVARANQPFDEKKYFSNLATANTTCDVTGSLTLTTVINKKRCFKDTKWRPSSLNDIAGVQLQKEAADALARMMAAADTSGVGFEVTSGFRTYDEQAELYQQEAELGNSGQPVDLISARAGHSEHQTGLAVDLKIADCVLECFGTTRRYEWLSQHAAEYGFIERYPSSLGEITGYVHEPWHWRYIGKNAAMAMKQQRIETMEMYFAVPGGDYYAR